MNPAAIDDATTKQLKREFENDYVELCRMDQPRILRASTVSVPINRRLRAMHFFLYLFGVRAEPTTQ
jgi:hypothetical protein